jgi:hypothetical protein
MISYTHIQDPQGPRFQQYEKDKIPCWATDIRIEPSLEDLTEEQKTQLDCGK